MNLSREKRKKSVAEKIFFKAVEFCRTLCYDDKNQNGLERNSQMKNFIEEFKKFALRGNVLDMAVGIIIGGAFTAIVTALTTNFIQPLLTIILTWSWELLTWRVIGQAIANFGTAVVNFLLTALVLFILLKLVNGLMNLRKKPEAPTAPTTKTCPYCKSTVAIDATRCAHCTSELKD